MTTIRKLDHIRETCKEMLADRNYILLHEDKLHIQALRTTVDNKHVVVHVYIIEQEKLNINVMKYYYTLFETENVSHAILVFQNITTSSVKRILSNIQNKVIELFSVNELLFNITRHVLVPLHMHVSITADHKETLKYPVLKRTDAVAKYYRYVFGNLIQIYRKDGSIYFRLVK